FGNTMVVQDLASGLRYWREHEQVSVVTLAGERIDASGIVVGGASDAANTGLLQQKREIHQLQMDLQAAMQTLGELEQALQQQTELRKQTEQEWENKEQELRIAEDHKRSLAQEI